MNIADKYKAFTRNQLESITVVNKDDQKRMIDDQIEQNRKIKEEPDGGSKENGKLDESSLDDNEKWKIGDYDAGLIKRYIQHIEQVTGRKLHTNKWIN